MQLLVVVSLLLTTWQIVTSANPNSLSSPGTRDWWQVAQFYQIYPRSFMDSNGDGIGDLRGIISKLDYLKEIGVTATWLSPIFKSPMVDFGYDISDFYDIQDEYGTLADFDELIREANARGIKVILDFVPNHSSDENEWFLKSVNREKGYEDFYMWHDGYVLENGTRVPPSNWLQAFRGSAWEWNEKRGQYYLHQFAVEQPDFNFRNPAVVAQLKDVLTYWLDRGVAGFRIDAVSWCFEVETDATGRYPDEPLSGYTNDPDDSVYLRHIYTQDLPETIDMIYQWRQLMDDYQRLHGGDTRILMIESYSALDYVMQMYGNSTTEGAQIPFNFQFITGGNGDKYNTEMPASEFVRIINLWLNRMPANRTANWVMGNHDQRRVGSRYGENRIDIMNMLQMFLPGVSVTYMGEELGMLDLNITWEETRDPAACNSNPFIYQHFTRDPARTPFQWSSKPNAGFSSNSSTWLPVNPNHVTINVETERAQSISYLNVYKKLVELRKSKTLQYGDVSVSSLGDSIVAIKRSLPDDSTYVMLANVKDEIASGDITNILNFNAKLEVKIAGTLSNKKPGDILSAENFTLEPNESVIVEIFPDLCFL